MRKCRSSVATSACLHLREKDLLAPAGLSPALRLGLRQAQGAAGTRSSLWMMDLLQCGAGSLHLPISPGTDFPASTTWLTFLFTPVTQGCRKSAADCEPVPLPPLSYGTSRAPCPEAGWLPPGGLSPTAERGTAGGSGNRHRRHLADIQAKGMLVVPLPAAGASEETPTPFGSAPLGSQGRRAEPPPPPALRGWDLLPSLRPGTWAA